MSKKSHKRFAEEQEMKRNKRLIAHVEALGAAYAKVSEIHPTECCLMVEEIPGPVKKLKYWYDKHEPKVNDQLAHPHVKFLFNQANAIYESQQSENPEMLKVAVENIVKFIGVYNDFDKHIADEIAAGKKVSDAGEQSGGDPEDTSTVP